MKQQILSLMQATGFFAPFRLANRGKALVVTYHRFAHGNAGVKTASRAFAEQLDYLARHYEIVPLSFIAARLAARQGLPANVAAITIDDGYSDAYEIAFPLLRERNLPATVFVVTDFVDRKRWLWTDKLRYLISRAGARTIEGTLDNSEFCVEFESADSIFCAADKVNSLLKSVGDGEKEMAIARMAAAFGVEMPAAPPREYASITWEQVREMSDAGVEIGSHTATHPILPNVPVEHMRRELVESRERIAAEIGRPVDLFCYPNGNYNDAVMREVERAGYRCAVTVENGLNDEHGHPLALKRIHAEYDLPHFIQSTSGFAAFKVSLRRALGSSAILVADRQYELG
ncbi:MAG TPA: polysaccharide deacetylase family protein [Blastocatellia bacterium]|nr:polysaccharide deacetylase family protein [Blastocatellia bacterium]